MSERRKVYLDHSATTPTDPRVVDAMMPYFTEVYGNPSSVHSFGRDAERAIEKARATIAGIFNCKPAEIVFTSGGSESDNLALRGAAIARRAATGRHALVTSPVEHSAIGRTVQQMAHVMAFDERIVGVDKYGQIAVDELKNLLDDDVALVSIMYANNEVGTVQPIEAIAKLAREKGALMHTDAVQGAGQLTLDVQQLGVDMLSISAHKFYGPKGVGALYIREGIDIVPSQSGGSHEQGRRAGTHNTPFIVGMAKALELAYAEFDERVAHYTGMRDMLISQVLEQVSDVELSGHPTNRLPSHASFVFDGVDANKLLIHLDLKGVAASSASACKTGNPEPSSVLLAMGYDRERALGSLRLTVGQATTEADIAYAVEVIKSSVEAVRKMNLLPSN